jgi:hypothetical protein
VQEVFRSSKFGVIYGVRAITDVDKAALPHVTSMRRYADDIDHADAGQTFGFGMNPDPQLEVGKSYTFAGQEVAR